MKNIIVKKAQSEKEINDALDVRYQVFVVEQKIDKDIELDGLDQDCDHFVAYIDGLAVGAGRIRYLDNNKAKIERMAVLSEFRGKKIGGEILRTMVSYLTKNKIIEIVLNSQYHAKAFYEKFGFKPQGKIFTEANIDHIKMTKNLTYTSKVYVV